MSKLAPMFASERRAAALLDLPVSTFRDLVAQGALPRPLKLADIERWDVAQLERAIRGDAIEGMGDVEW